jgi:hypothetical protein
MQGRTRSSDRQPEESFPISQLKDAAELARLLDRRGGRMRYDDLAAALGQQRNSGAFRGKTAAGQMFGVIETVSREASLTELGRRMAAPDTEADSLAEAFLHVPLYRALYGRYAADGGKLPMIRDIDVDIERLGVSPNRVTKARQVFLGSAETAGYFRSGRDRLIRPSSDSPGTAAGTILSGRGTPTIGGGGTLEPKELAEVSHAEAVQMSALMQGLVAKLPPEGERYTRQQRQRWLDAAKNILDIVYADDDEPDPAPARLNGLASAHSQPS